MAKVALVEKYPSNINYGKFFDFEFDKYSLTDTNVKRLTKKDIKIEIDSEQYDYIIMVGAEPTKYFCKHASVTSHQGYLIDEKYLPVVSPLLVKLKPENKGSFENAVKNIIGYIDGSKGSAPTLSIIGTQDPDEVKAYLKELLAQDKCFVALDTEGTALYPRDGYVIGIVLSYKDDEGLYFTTDIVDDEIEELLQHIFYKHMIVFHNSKYDRSMLEYHFGFKFKHIEDTMLQHYILDETEGTHSLKDLSIKYTELGDYDRELVEFKKSYCRAHKVKQQDFTYDLIPFDIMVPYAATDGIATRLLNKKFLPIIEKNPKLKSVYRNILLPGSNFLLNMQEIGVPFSRVKLKEARIQLDEEIDKLTKALYNFPAVAKLEKEQGAIFNVNSPAQVINLLYSVLKLKKVNKKTDTGNWSVDKDVLAELSKQHELPGKLLEIKQLKKIQSTYIIKILAGLDNDDRLRTNFNIHTTSSGRLSSSGKLNMQQLPRDNKIVKKCIAARDGYKIVAVDLGTAEMYIAAALSGDPGLAKIFASGGDFHSESAILAFSLNVPSTVTDRRAWVEENHPNLRQASKAISFGILYGSGPAKVAETASITLDEAKEVIATYFRRFPKLKQWLDAQKEFILQNGYIYSAFGRKRRLKNVFSGDKEVSGHAVRSGVNFLVQSIASDINLLGAIGAQKEAEDKNLDAKIFALVHDAVLAEVKECDIENYNKIIIKHLQKDYGVKIKGVPIGVDLGVGDTYAEAA
jgi:DNA polymerase I-like protein with 3'-5' exonuclease and polymerase domains